MNESNMQAQTLGSEGSGGIREPAAFAAERMGKRSTDAEKTDTSIGQRTNERTKRGSWILLFATAASAAAVEAREGRAAERKRLCKMGKKKEVGGESSGRGSEEGRQHAARTHAPSLLSPKQSSSQRAEGGRKEVAALRRSVAPSSSSASSFPSFLPSLSPCRDRARRRRSVGLRRRGERGESREGRKEAAEDVECSFCRVCHPFEPQVLEKGCGSEKWL